MGLPYVAVGLKGLGTKGKKYEAAFLVNTGATDPLAPAAALRRAGIKPAGKMVYELADGSLQKYDFGLAEISFMGEVNGGPCDFWPGRHRTAIGHHRARIGRRDG